MQLTDLLRELDVPFITEGHHHCRPNWLQVNCPFCSKRSDKYHMGISLQWSNANCWRCGSHSLIDTLIELTGLDRNRVAKLLKNTELRKNLGTFTEKRTGTLKLPANVGGLTKAHKKYLKNRGFTDIAILQQLWNVQGLSISARLSWRLFVPITFHGETVSWTTRSLNDTQTRWITAGANEESLPHRDLLYGEDYARHAIIVCEGIVDVWKIGPGAVATMGVNYSKAQFNKMLRYPVRAICYDNEPDAQRRAGKLVDELSIYPGDTFRVQLDSKDPGCATEKELKKLRKILK